MKFKILFTISLLHVVTLVDCSKHPPSLSNISQTDSKIIVATGLILSQIDLISCLYVFVRTYLRWKQYKKRSIPMSLRYPFYIVSVEFCLSILQIINSSRSPVVSTLLCNMIGLLSMLLIGFAMNLVTFVTLVTWYKVKKDIEFNSGQYDYILFLTSSGLSIFYTLLGLGENGNIKHWCSSNGKTFLYMVLSIAIIHLSFILILYSNTRTNLMKSKTNQLSFNARDLPEDNPNEKDTLKKMISYSLAFGFQLTLITLYIIIAANVENAAVELFRILGITIGGLLIALQYIINEGWKHNQPPSTPSSPISEKRTTLSSIRDSIQHLPFTRIQVEVVQQQTSQQDIWSTT